MARSKYVYIVQDGCDVVATFTVKHELSSWLEVRRMKDDWKPEMRVLRYLDNATGRQSGEIMGDDFWRQFV